MFLMAAVVALSVGTLIALQALISPTVAFFGLVIGGVALGLSGTDMKKTATYALLAGFFAYFLGTVAFAAAASIGGGYPGDDAGGHAVAAAEVRAQGQDNPLNRSGRRGRRRRAGVPHSGKDRLRHGEIWP